MKKKYFKKIGVIIPARYNSERLPGKPLIKINGEALVMKTFKKVNKVFPSEDIFITSDNQKVLDEFKHISKNLILVKKNCLNGTERCSYAINKIKKNYKYFLITSCDMPFLNIGVLKYLIKKINNTKKIYDAFTVHTSVKNLSILKNTNIAKVVLNLNNEIIYISRNVIPSLKNYNHDYNNFFKKKKKKFFSHHGLMAIKKPILKKYAYLKNSYLQISEDNEWLKFLEYGYKIKSFYYKSIAPEINTKKDLRKFIPIYFKKI